ncbi:MAG: hypothetical protein A3F17_00960 [Gammaproteobacteria bacterium RIFCSPHIGHO2_12_FULL_41_15]|nr:MAG: hypothetical protein A3F17_00960 [Gammaproteobacteria bacterium RIFCSPHIGHO2_12_FULL_41_15]
MNQNDRQLITNLSERLRQAQPVQKDTEADHVIAQHIATQPDAVYLLTQAVLLQEQAIRTLQQQMHELQKHTKPKQGFFSSLLGGRNAEYQQPTATPRNAFGNNSFLSSALTTAVGVAGGMFLFEGLSHLFSGSHAASDSMLSNAGLGDPFQGQSTLLDEGFGAGDSFMDDTPSSGLGGDDFGGWDDGFGGGF